MLDLRIVYECNCCLGCKILYLQVGIINLENFLLEEDVVKFEFYVVLLIEDCLGGCCCCGWKYYDYFNVIMVFFIFGEIFCMSKENMLLDKGYFLVFYFDLLFCILLKNYIKNYIFFYYCKEEVLYFLWCEIEKVMCCFLNIEDELYYFIDIYSSIIFFWYIEFLLDYCIWYYECQFIICENKNKVFLENMECLFVEYIVFGRL